MKKYTYRVMKDIVIRATFILDIQDETERQERLSALVRNLQGCLFDTDYGDIETNAGQTMAAFSFETTSEYIEETVEENTLDMAQAALSVMSKEYIQGLFREEIVDVIFSALNFYIEKHKEGNAK